MKVRSTTATRTIGHLLLLFVILILTSCNYSPLPEDLPARTPTATGAATDIQQQTEAAESSTPLPTAAFQGVSLTFDARDFGDLEESVRQSATAAGARSEQPEHIKLTFGGSDYIEEPEILVYPIAQYMAMKDDAASHIGLLKKMLQERLVQPSSVLSLYPLAHEVDSFLFTPSYVDFENGKGISFVSQIDHDSAQQLLYSFQGITDDGKYYVTAILPVVLDELAAEDDENKNEVVAQVANRQIFLDPDFGFVLKSLNNSMRSIEIHPQEGFPSSSPAAYVTYPGILLSYDPEISGQAAVDMVPPIYTSSEGTSVFLAGVPDAVQVSFGLEEHGQKAMLLIQPLRGATKQFFPSIPAEQQQQIQAIEDRFAGDGDLLDEQNGNGFERLIPFQSGFGLRRVKEASLAVIEDQGQVLTYQFQGVTDNGRYYISFEHPILSVGSLEENLLDADTGKSAHFLRAVSYLDQVIQSLIVAPDASTNSSMPVNPADCLLDAQFVKDVTVPDHTIIERGETFTKTWLVRNSGKCTWTPAYQLKLDGGNPVSWTQSSPIAITAAGDETEISVDIVSPEIAGIYQAWWQLTDEMGEPFGPVYNLLFEAPPPATDTPGYGVIEGELDYPASGMPALTIYFLSTDGSQRFALETEEGWTHYANELPAGDYYVFARVSGDRSDSGGGYTAAAICGLTCEDHTLIEVVIEEGKSTRDINILDWYAPAGTFPLP